MGKPGPDWTKAEDYILRNEAGLTARQIMALLPNRTACAIRSRRKLLMAKPADMPVEYRNSWTPEQDDILRALNAEGLNYTEIAMQMNRTPNGVKHRMSKLSDRGENFSFSKSPPPKLDPWPDMPKDAFKDIRVSADPRTTMSRPETRTNGGVGSRMLLL
jgi:hypothetical protein